jgi:hypothetical protein
MYLIENKKLNLVQGGSLTIGIALLKVAILGVVKYGFDRWRSKREARQIEVNHELALEREKELADIRYNRVNA